MCIDKTNWDSELKGETLTDCYRIPRCYFSHQPIDVQIHGFCDASERAYAAVVFRSRGSAGRF